MSLVSDFKSELNDRTLWFDGESSIKNFNLLYDRILKGKSISQFKVFEITPEVKKYNNENDESPLIVKNELKKFNFDWNIPEQYISLDIKQYIYAKLENEIRISSFNEEDIKIRVKRVMMELKLWESNNLLDLLKTLIFIVDTFNEKQVVWGTGRGSSCCCYILYLIGLHDVDSVQYKLDINEFFRK